MKTRAYGWTSILATAFAVTLISMAFMGTMPLAQASHGPSQNGVNHRNSHSGGNGHGSGSTNGISHGPALKGNGAPNGPHFDINVIGSNIASCSSDNGSGHALFVPLYGSTPILLINGPSFSVVQDGCGGTPIVELPSSNTTGGLLAYTVWGRALGKPGGNGTLAACGVTNISSGAYACSSDSFSATRGHGKQPFTDATWALTTITYTTGNSTQTVNLFGGNLSGYFWSYDNNGLGLLQLRFYPTR